MAKSRNKELARERRHRRVRVRVHGTAERPRLNVFRSLQHIYAQVIDDKLGYSILSACTLDAEIVERIGKLNKTEQAKVVGEVLAKRALDKGVKQVVFDRGGYQYHGRVKALADGARAGGLEF